MIIKIFDEKVNEVNEVEVVESVWRNNICVIKMERKYYRRSY
jgi:hypothetical protein